MPLLDVLFNTTTLLSNVLPFLADWRITDMSRRPQQTGFSRVFVIQNSAGPAYVPVYQGLWMAGPLTWPQGDITTIKVPSETQYDRFDVVDKVAGDQGDPSMPITARYTMDRSELLRLTKIGCDNDLQVHMGQCGDPRDFNAGWEKIVVLEKARITNYSTGALGALQPADRAMINEEVPFTGERAFEILRQTVAQQAAAQVVQEVLDITVCDAVTCGACGIASDGCQIVFALTISAGGSPGLPAEIVFTRNGGSTWSDTLIDTLAPSEDPVRLACVGSRLVVTNQTPGGIHYAPIADILAGTEVWVESTAGLTIPTGGPRAILSVSPAHTWVFGAGGYIYFYSDITGTAATQSPGDVTTQQFNAAHATDVLNLVAVGNSNAVVYTRNGGSTWVSVTGPAPAVNLNAVWMKSRTEWLVGTAGGRLFYTQNSGTTWTEKAFPGSGAGVVRDLSFTNNTVGYMTHDTAAVLGRVLRTIDGGNSWYIAPESGQGTTPDNDRLNAVSACKDDPNVAFVGGLGANAIDGIILKAA